jgi:hypothetical protein
VTKIITWGEMNNSSIWSELSIILIITFCVVVVGIFFALFVRWVRKKYASKNYIKVYCDMKVTRGEIKYGGSPGTPDSELLAITISNDSKRKVTISNVGFTLESGYIFSPLGTNQEKWEFPKYLDEGESCQYTLSLDNVKFVIAEKNSVIKSAWAVDVTGQSFDVDLSENLKKRLRSLI